MQKGEGAGALTIAAWPEERPSRGCSPFPARDATDLDPSMNFLLTYTLAWEFFCPLVLCSQL